MKALLTRFLKFPSGATTTVEVPHVWTVRWLAIHQSIGDHHRSQERVEAFFSEEDASAFRSSLLAARTLLRDRGVQVGPVVKVDS